MRVTYTITADDTNRVHTETVEVTDGADVERAMWRWFYAQQASSWGQRVTAVVDGVTVASGEFDD